MNYKLCQVLTIFLITLNNLDSARGFKGNRFLNQEKGTVDIFGGEYDHHEDDDLDVEIDLHEKPNENEKVSNKKISLFRGTARKNEVDTFYDEFHGSDVSGHSVVIKLNYCS